MKIKIVIMGIVAILIQSNLEGQSLEEFLDIAMENNFGIKASEMEYAASLEKIPQVAKLPDPEINAGVFVLPPETRLGPQRLAIGATQMLPWPGTFDARKAVLTSQSNSKYQQIDALKLSISYQVKTAYLKVYELEKKAEIIAKNIPLFRSMESLVLVKSENGKADIADVLQIQMKIRDLEQQLELIAIQRKKAIASLNKSLGRAVDSEVTINTTLSMAELNRDKNQLLISIQNSHPMVKKISADQESAQKVIELNLLNAKPTFGAGLDYIMVGERIDAAPEKNGRDILVPKIKIKVPLYREKYTAKSQEEKLKIAALENKKDDLSLEFSSIMEQALADLDDAKLKFALYQEQKKTLQSILEIKTEKYSQIKQQFRRIAKVGKRSYRLRPENSQSYRTKSIGISQN